MFHAKAQSRKEKDNQLIVLSTDFLTWRLCGSISLYRV